MVKKKERKKTRANKVCLKMTKYMPVYFGAQRDMKQESESIWLLEPMHSGDILEALTIILSREIRKNMHMYLRVLTGF
jgi:hypothetical protein